MILLDCESLKTLRFSLSSRSCRVILTAKGGVFLIIKKDGVKFDFDREPVCHELAVEFARIELRRAAQLVPPNIGELDNALEAYLKARAYLSGRTDEYLRHLALD